MNVLSDSDVLVVSGNSMYLVAMVYFHFKRHKDALVMAQKALEIRRRVLPAGHPHIIATQKFIQLLHSSFIPR